MAGAACHARTVCQPLQHLQCRQSASRLSLLPGHERIPDCIHFLNLEDHLEDAFEPFRQPHMPEPLAVVDVYHSSCPLPCPLPLLFLFGQYRDPVLVCSFRAVRVLLVPLHANNECYLTRHMLVSVDLLRKVLFDQLLSVPLSSGVPSVRCIDIRQVLRPCLRNDIWSCTFTVPAFIALVPRSLRNCVRRCIHHIVADPVQAPTQLLPRPYRIDVCPS